MGGRLMLVLLLLDAAETDPLDAAFRAIGRAAGDRSPLALLPPEIEGLDADLGPLAARAALVLGTGRKILLPEAVSACAGRSPNSTALGLGGVARRCGARAALFLRLTVSSEGIELFALLADEQGNSLLDQVFPLPALTPVRPRTAAAPAKAAAPAPAPAPATATPAAPAPVAPTDARTIWAARSIALRDEASGLFRVIQAGHSIGELELVRAAGDDFRISALEAQIGDLRFPRRLGIGLTLSGFVAAGLCLPLLRADESGQITGGVIIGTGLLAASVGLWVWLRHGEEVTAGGPSSDRNLLRRAEAEQLVERYNATLRRELGL